MKKFFLILVSLFLTISSVQADLLHDNYAVRANYDGTAFVEVRHQPETHPYLPFANIVFFGSNMDIIAFAPLYSLDFKPLYDNCQRFRGEFIASKVKIIKWSNNIINFNNSQLVPFDKSMYTDVRIGHNNKSEDLQKISYYPNPNNQDIRLELNILNDKVQLSSIGNWGSYLQNPIVVVVFYNKKNKPIAYQPYYGNSLKEIRPRIFSSEFTKPQGMRTFDVKKWEYVNLVILEDFGDV